MLYNRFFARKSEIMKLRVPIVKTSLDISSWFLVRGRSAGKEITHKKLQYLMYLAYGNYFIEKFFMPALEKLYSIFLRDLATMIFLEPSQDHG